MTKYNKLTELCKTPEWYIFVVFLFIILFSLPFVVSGSGDSLYRTFLYIFLCWLLLVVILFVSASILGKEVALRDENDSRR